MNILAVDATTEVLTVAVESGGKVFRASRRGLNTHDDQLWPAVDAALKKAKLRFEDLDALAAASGPGRFTGIRIGLSFAAAAGYAYKIPAVAVSRLEAAADRVAGVEVVGVLPGWKGEVYHQRFKRSRNGAMKALAKAEWTAPEAWTGAKDIEDTGAAELLPAAKRYLKAKRRPPFEPFYLKPAGYEKAQR